MEKNKGKKGERNKGGRPKKQIDQEEFEKLCGLQCTQEEMCCFLNVCSDTLNTWCKKTYKTGFSETFSIKRGIGKISLRRNQFRLAEKSAAMAIFLGQQFLGQRNYTSIEGAVDNRIDEINKNLLALSEIIKAPQPTHEIKVNESE